MLRTRIREAPLEAMLLMEFFPLNTVNKPTHYLEVAWLGRIN